jgi:hypothetical protein
VQDPEQGFASAAMHHFASQTGVICQFEGFMAYLRHLSFNFAREGSNERSG